MSSNVDVLSAIHNSYSNEVLSQSNKDPNRKSKRRVRFPEDNELISDYLEPFKPVPDNCTSDELLAAYLSACYQYKIQPIDFLLEQLKGIDLSICNERYSRLSLRGFRLNRSHVETMEEIFRRVHFRELDFENTFLDDQSASALFDMLLHYETCSNLRISLNLDKANVSQAWHHCVTFLRKSNALKQFTLSHTPLTVTNFLGLTFFGLCLERLSFIDCNLSGQCLFSLVRWLQILLSSASLYPVHRYRIGSMNKSTTNGIKACITPQRSNSFTSNDTHIKSNCISNPDKPAIWELKLALISNKLNSSDAENLVALIRHQLFVPTEITTNGINSKHQSIKLENNLNNVQNNALPIGGIGFVSDLDLSHNNLGDEGLRILCTGLIQGYQSRLRHVNADSPTFIGQEAVDHSFNPASLINSTAASGLETKRSVNMNVRSLERLSLVNNHLSAVGMSSLVLTLIQTPANMINLVGGLISLDLSYNENIRDTGVEILCEGLIRNHTLKELYLRSIQMSFPGIFALSGFLSESKYLKLLDIRDNNLDLAGLMGLSKILVVNHTLTTLLTDATRLLNSVTSESNDKELLQSLVNNIESNLTRNRLNEDQEEVEFSKTPPKFTNKLSPNSDRSIVSNEDNLCRIIDSKSFNSCDTNNSNQISNYFTNTISELNGMNDQENTQLVETEIDFIDKSKYFKNCNQNNLEQFVSTHNSFVIDSTTNSTITTTTTTNNDSNDNNEDTNSYPVNVSSDVSFSDHTDQISTYTNQSITTNNLEIMSNCLESNLDLERNSLIIETMKTFHDNSSAILRLEDDYDNYVNDNNSDDCANDHHASLFLSPVLTTTTSEASMDLSSSSKELITKFENVCVDSECSIDLHTMRKFAKNEQIDIISNQKSPISLVANVDKSDINSHIICD